MRIFKKALPAVSFLACLALISFSACAAQPKKEKETDAEKEAREAEKEEASEKELGDIEQVKLLKMISGKISLAEKDDATPNVVATIITSTGTHLLKAKDPTILQTLTALNGKNAVISGHWRNAGKYFIVEHIGAPEEGRPLQHPSRGAI